MGRQGPGRRPSKHGGWLAVGQFSAELLALEKDDAAIGTGLISEGHISFEPSPAKNFDGTAGDLPWSAIERAIEGLEIGKNLVVGCLALVADSDTREFTFEGHESHRVDRCRAKRRSPGFQFIGLRSASVLDLHEGVGF